MKFKIFFIIIILFFLLFDQEVKYDNVLSRFDLALSIVNFHTLNIDKYHKNTNDKAILNGHFYTDKAPLLPLYSSLILFVLKFILSLFGNDSIPIELYLTRWLTVSINFVIMLYFFYKFLSENFKSPIPELSTISLTLASPLTVYSSLYYSHSFSASLIFISFYLIIEGLKYDKLSNLKLLLAGFLSSFAVGSEYPAFIAFAILGIFIIFKKNVKFIIFLIGAIFPILITGIYHWYCFGSFFKTGYNFKFIPQHNILHKTGFFGITYPKLNVLIKILLSPYKGLFFLVPISLIAFIGILWGSINKKDYYLISLIIFISYLLFNSSFLDWQAGRTFGPRHTYISIPFLYLGLAFVLNKFIRNYFFTAGYFILFMVSTFNVLLAMITTPHVPLSFKSPLSQFWFTLLKLNYSSIKLLPTFRNSNLIYMGIALFIIIVTIMLQINRFIKNRDFLYKFISFGLVLLLGWIALVMSVHKPWSFKNVTDMAQILTDKWMFEEAGKWWELAYKMDAKCNECLRAAIVCYRRAKKYEKVVELQWIMNINNVTNFGRNIK